MNDKNKISGWFGLLGDLGNTKPTRFSRAVQYIGTIAGGLVAVVLVLYQGEQLDADSLAVRAGGIAYFVVIVAMFILAVRHLAIAKSGKADVNGIGGVFWRTFLYIFFPALVIAGLLFGAAFILQNTQ